MNHGPTPCQQQSWDWRAAGNFIGGGAGSGLIVFTAASGAHGAALTVLMLAGLALIGGGLLCVWLELGRPLRALHVFFNPRTSWMTREAITATLLFPIGMAAAVGVPGFAMAGRRAWRLSSSTARAAWCKRREESRPGASRWSRR